MKIDRATLIKQQGSPALKAAYIDELEETIRCVRDVLKQRACTSGFSMSDRETLTAIRLILDAF